MFTGGIFLRVFTLKKRELVGRQVETRWQMLPAMIMVVPYIIWAGFRGDNFGDTGAYRRMFSQAPNTLGQMSAYLDEITKDKGFSVIIVLIKSIFGNSDVGFFLLLAAIQILCVALVFRKYSCDYWFSIFLFIASTDYFSWAHNGIRQFLAVSIIFAATGLILKKRYIPAILIILIAATIHGSALLMIPIIFIIQGKAWNKKTLLCVLTSIIILLFIGQFTDILDTLLSDTQYKNVVSDWQSWADDGMNPIRVLVYAIPTLLSLFGYKRIKYEDNPVINIAVNSSIVSTSIALVATGTSGIFIGRLPIYCSMYGYILLPWEIKHLFKRQMRTTIYAVAIVCYFVFFYYQMHFVWGLL